MRVLLRRISLFCLQIMVVLVCTLTPAHVSAEEKVWSDAFNKQIKAWISDLSAKDREFENWKTARTSVQTLGPNSMQWLVTLSVRDKRVGYMVVAEEKQKKGQDDPQFVLMEYGLGEFILFNDSIAPKQKGTQAVYDGFASFWKYDSNGLTEYVDAKTGERYPSMVRPDKRIMDSLTEEDLALPGLSLTKSASFGQIETDPFDNIDWMKAEPVENSLSSPVSWEDIVQSHNQKTVVVTASLFQDEVFAPFTVGSVHVWGDKTTYVGVWDEGLRYLPSAYITRVGKIVQ